MVPTCRHHRVTLVSVCRRNTCQVPQLAGLSDISSEQSSSSTTTTHLSPACENLLQQLDWLTAEQRITYKLGLLMHFIHIGQAIQQTYLSGHVPVSAVSIDSGRHRLRSTNSANNIQARTRTKFRECVHYSGTSDLHDITDADTDRNTSCWA